MQRREMFINKSSQRVHCLGQRECERELAAGEVGVFCGPTLGTRASLHLGKCMQQLVTLAWLTVLLKTVWMTGYENVL